MGTHPPASAAVPRDAGHADAVVAARGDDPGDAGAVAEVVGGLVVALDEVPPAPVVDVAVAVVVDAVVLAAAAGLARVAPQVRREVRLAEADARVHHGDLDVGRAGRAAPRVDGIDVGARDAGRVVDELAVVAQAPFLVEERVVRHAGAAHAPVGLRPGDARVALEGGGGLGRVGVLGDPDDGRPRRAQRAPEPRAAVAERVRAPGAVDPGAELDDQLARRVVVLGRRAAPGRREGARGGRCRTDHHDQCDQGLLHRARRATTRTARRHALRRALRCVRQRALARFTALLAQRLRAAFVRPP